VSFTYGDDFDPMWVPHRPELAAAANAISLGMPYAEPLFIKAVRSAYEQIDDDLRARTETYIRQETGHHTQHKRFNDLVSARYPATVRLQRTMARHANWVGRRSRRFRVAYAAGGETISYAVARWTEGHLSEFHGADPVPTTLFLWHLAEEVEHKANTYDVFEATNGSRLRYAWAMTVGFTSLVLFTIVGALLQLRGERRLRYPATWWRLGRLSLSLAYVIIPTMVVSTLPGHHPDDFTDPVFLPAWLAQYDPVSGSMPVWTST
jgi:uncharacterized protein